MHTDVRVQRIKIEVIGLERLSKWSQQPAHFTVYSEKRAGYSECLGLNFQPGSMTLYRIPCITIRFLKNGFSKPVTWFFFLWIVIIFSFVVISRRVSFVLVLRNTIKCGQRQWHRKKRRALWLLAPLSALHKGNAFSHLIAFPTCVLYVFFFYSFNTRQTATFDNTLKFISLEL